MRTTTLARVLLVSSIAAAPARAATAPPATAAGSPDAANPEDGLSLSRITLRNGLQALLLADPAAPMAGVFAVVRAGSIHERPDEAGLSHFLEHLLFNGTTRWTQEQLYAAVDAMGGYSNATTRADHTVFQMLVPRARLGEALSIHADMLFRSTLPAEKLEKERGIVLEEIAREAARPEHALEDAFRAFAWDGSAAARPVLGTPATLATISRQAVHEYWQRRYVVASTTVLVVGDTDPAALTALLEKSYGTVPPGLAPGPGELPALAPGYRLRTLPLELGQVALRVALAGPDPSHPDAWALDLLAALLSQGPGPSLERGLRARGIAGAGGTAWLDRAGGASTFQLSATAPSGTDPQAFLRALLQTAASAASELTAEELGALRTRLRSAAALLAEKPHYFGIEKAALLVNAGAGAVEAEGSSQHHMDRARIAAASARWLAGRPYRALAAGPGLAAAEVDLGDAAATRPSRGPAPRPERLTRVLANGVRLSVSSNPATRVLAAHVLLTARAAAEGEAGPGYADLLQRLLARRGEPFTRELAAMGAVLKTTDDPALPFDDYYDVPEYGYVRLETVSEHARAAAEALATLLSPPSFDDTALEAARSEQLALLAREDGSAAARSARALGRRLYGAASALARSPRGDAAAVAAVSRAQLLEAATRWLDPHTLVVTVETGLAAPHALELFASALARLAPGGPTSEATPGVAPVPTGSTPCAAHEETLGGKQSYLRLGRAVSVTPADRAAFQLAAALLSERLAAEIRERRGMAYSIGASVAMRRPGLPDAWIASAGTRPENAVEVAAAMLEIAGTLVREGPAEQELALAAARLSGRELMRRLTGIGRAHDAGLDLDRGDPPGAGMARLEAIDQVSMEAVRAALRRWFDPAFACAVSVR